jgi:CheY-like chemotaxis protein
MKTNPPVSVLVVDDDAIVRDSMGAYLGNRGYSVLKAACGDEGLELFAREQPDIVLLDLRMPGMDGLDVLGHLSREAPDTPVIVISGMGVVGDVVEALRRGAWDYLVKPVRDLRVLVSAMERCLERAALLRERVAREQRLEDLVALRTAELEESNARLSERKSAGTGPSSRSAPPVTGCSVRRHPGSSGTRCWSSTPIPRSATGFWGSWRPRGVSTTPRSTSGVLTVRF